MPRPRRAAFTGLLAGLLSALFAVLLAGCTTGVTGTAQPTPPPPRVVAPERIQFRPVVQDLAEPIDPSTSVTPVPGATQLGDRDGHQYIVGPAFMDGTQVASAQAAADPNGLGWVITVVLTSDGSATFTQFTTAHTGQQLAIVVADVVVTAPVIQAAITGGQVQIAGQFTQEDATKLADRINGR